MSDRSQTDRFTYLIAKLHRFAHTGLENRLQKHGISVEQWRVLESLGGRHGYSMGELANAVLMNHPALTKMIDRMVSNGLVHRAPDPTDQRRVLVYATDRGAIVANKLRSIVSEHEKEISNILSGAGAREIEAVLKNAGEALQEQDLI